MARLRNASRLVAHWYPSSARQSVAACLTPRQHLLLYICTPNRGKAAAKLDRAKLFAASALAAYKGYCLPSVTGWRALRCPYAVDEKGKHARIDENYAAVLLDRLLR